MSERPIEGVDPAGMPGRQPARRRFLKHGLAGGSVALLVAGKPVKTLAKAYCKFSGWNSVKNFKKGKSKKGKKSGLTLSNAPKTCSVKLKSPSSYYKKTKSKKRNKGYNQGYNQNQNQNQGYTITYATANWPSSFYTCGTLTSNTTFNQMFGTHVYDSYGGYSLLYILYTYPSSVEAYMIAAAFAATNGGSGFSISPEYVYDLWQNNGQSNQTALLTFLEQLV